jgi:hypothetical protein
MTGGSRLQPKSLMWISTRELDFGVTSVNYKPAELLAKGEPAG